MSHGSYLFIDCKIKAKIPNNQRFCSFSLLFSNKLLPLYIENEITLNNKR